MKIPAAGKAELVYTNEAGEETRELIHQFDGPGIIQGHAQHLTLPSKALPKHALIMHWTPIRISGLQQKIPFPRNMTIHSKTFSRKSLMQNTKRNLMQQALNTSIH